MRHERQDKQKDCEGGLWTLQVVHIGGSCSILATRCSGPEVDLVRGIVLFMVGPGSSCNMYAKQYYAK